MKKENIFWRIIFPVLLMVFSLGASFLIHWSSFLDVFFELLFLGSVFWMFFGNLSAENKKRFERQQQSLEQKIQRPKKMPYGILHDTKKTFDFSVRKKDLRKQIENYETITFWESYKGQSALSMVSIVVLLFLVSPEVFGAKTLPFLGLFFLLMLFVLRGLFLANVIALLLYFALAGIFIFFFQNFEFALYCVVFSLPFFRSGLVEWERKKYLKNREEWHKKQKEDEVVEEKEIEERNAVTYTFFEKNIARKLKFYVYFMGFFDFIIFSIVSDQSTLHPSEFLAPYKYLLFFVILILFLQAYNFMKIFMPFFERHKKDEIKSRVLFERELVYSVFLSFFSFFLGAFFMANYRFDWIFVAFFVAPTFLRIKRILEIKKQSSHS